MKLTVNFPYHVNQQTADNIENNLGYIDDRIIDFTLNIEKQLLIVEISDSSFTEEITQKINALLLKVQPAREFNPDIYFDNMSVNARCKNDVFNEMIEKKDVQPISPGLYAISGQPLQMLNKFDKHIMSFIENFGAHEVSYPVLTPIEDLRQASFFKRTPQHANFVTLLHEDSEKISDFCKLLDDKDSHNLFKYFQNPSHICRTAICSNCYPTYKNTTLKNGESICLTTVGRAFRNESKTVRSLERLHEFSMREIIFIGDKQTIDEKLLLCLDWFKNFLKNINLKGKIQTASDPFYADNLRALQFYQFAEQSKLEVRLTNPLNNNEVSCASINNHGHHFAKAFNIKLESGEYATTACVGWGFERTIFLILSQFGLEEDQWPSSLKAIFQ